MTNRSGTNLLASRQGSADVRQSTAFEILLLDACDLEMFCMHVAP